MNCRIALAVISAGLASASPVLLQSGVSAGESNNQTGTNFLIPMLEPNWTPNQEDGASWISFENTGWQPADGGSAVMTLPNATPGNPNAIFYQTFTDTAGTSLSGTITVWADDTAAVYLDGALLAPASYTQSTTNCSRGITCTSDGTTITFATTPGTHTLTFDVYQLGGYTYGLMYDGSVIATGESVVPEPGPRMLQCAGTVVLTALLAIRRRREKRLTELLSSPKSDRD
jgi:hypothetical protein